MNDATPFDDFENDSILGTEFDNEDLTVDAQPVDTLEEDEDNLELELPDSGSEPAPDKEKEPTPDELEEESDDDIEDSDEDIQEEDNIYSATMASLGIDLDISELRPNDFEDIVKFNESVFEAGKQQYEKELESLNPEAYQIVKYVRNGGDINELIQTISNPTPTEIADVATAEQYLREVYKEKDLDEDVIEVILAKEKEAETLIDKANSHLSKLQEQNKSSLEEQVKQQEEYVKILQQKDIEFMNQTTETLAKEGLGKIRLPKTDIKNYQEFLFAHTNRAVDENGEPFYQLVLPIGRDTSSEEYQQALRTAFFHYKKGDPNKIATIKRKTLEVTRKLKSPKADNGFRWS